MSHLDKMSHLDGGAEQTCATQVYYRWESKGDAPSSWAIFMIFHTKYPFGSRFARF